MHPEMPTRIPSRTRGLLALTALALAAAMICVMAATPAMADAPSRSELIVLNVQCTVTGDFGTARLEFIHEQPATIAFGANVDVWAPGDDPMDDAPLWSGFDPDVRRDGGHVSGQVGLHDGSPGEGRGLDGNEIIGWASYDITIDPTGPTADYASYKGPLYSGMERENARFRTDKVRTPYTGAGTLTLPMLDEPLTIIGCQGDEIVDRVFVTQPAAVVSRGQYPAEFTCAVQTPEATLHVMVQDRDAVVVAVPDGSEDASMFGFGGVIEERDGLVAELEMYDGDWNPLDPASFAATLDVTRRSTVRHTMDGTRYTYRIDHLSVTGTVRIGDRDWTFSDCDGIRLQGHTITEPARGKSR